MIKPSTKVRMKGFGKKLACAATSVVLAVSLAPAAAFADAGSAGATTGGWYSLPTVEKTFTHTGTAHGKSYQYSYLTSGVSRVVGGFSQSMYYLLGINGINFDRGLRISGNADKLLYGTQGGSTTLITNHVTAVNGIMGTDVNIEPDEYLWNTCVDMFTNKPTHYAASDTAEARKASADTHGVYINSANVSQWDTIPVDIDGTPYNMPVAIYKEANFLSDYDKGLDQAWSNSGNTLRNWVKLENQRTGGSYNPSIGSWETNSSGINGGVKLFYALAAAVDEATEASRNADGNATLMSRYVDANGDDTSGAKYASAKALAQRYEDFAKATQYYMVKQIATGKVKSKVTAVICGYQPAKDGKQAAYACRIYDPSITGYDNDTANMGGRLANSIMNFTTDINTVLGESKVAYPANEADAKYVRWYSASDIVNAADAVFVSDCPSDNTIARYLATNNDGNRLGVYTTDRDVYHQDNTNINPLLEASAAAANGADVYYKFPCHLFGVWYAQGFENCWMAPMAAAYLYESNFTSIENVLAYAAKNFWHIKDTQVQNVLDAACYDISMPKNKTFGKFSSDYQSKLDTIMDEGNAYYIWDNANGGAIDAMNKGDLTTDNLADLKARTQSTYKAANTITAKGKTIKVKYKKLAKAQQTYKATQAVTVKNAQGKVTYTQVSGTKYAKVTKAGKVTVKKGLAKKTYTVKVNVKAAGNGSVKAKTVKNVPIKIQVA